jgi:formate-dependent nitrite reductase membrane component NrfD
VLSLPAGAGAGAFFVSVILDLMLARAAGSEGMTYPFRKLVVQRPLFASGYLISFIALGLSALCLVADLGRIDRILFLFVYPSFSYLTVGTYALTLLIICSQILAATWNPRLPWIRHWIVRIAEYVGLVTAAIVVVYTGLFLQSIYTVNFWASPFVPVLFVLSSFSTGVALLLVAWFFTGASKPFSPLLLRLARIDICVILAEALAVAAFFLSSLGDAEMHQVVLALLVGEFAPIFWGGFALCGIVVPLGMETLLVKRSLNLSLAWAACSVLVGGFFLRLCIVGVGIQPAL